MKLIDTACPHCGAALKIDPTNRNATCEYCGASLFIDDEVQHVQYDNAEEAGYKFEKGRQRAQTETRRSDTINSQQYRQPPKKRKTWLWVLGWICIFPLPLTILLLRKKDMKPILKYGIIAAAWIIYLLIGVAGGSRDSKKTTEQPSTPAVVESSQTNSKETKESETTTVTESKTTTVSEADSVKEAVSYADDVVVNRFITEFNDAYSDDIHDISKGNIRTKYYGYVRDTRLEMINANDADAEAFSISIYGGKEEVDREAMFAAFREVARILEPTLTDDAISGAVDDLISRDVLTENYQLGNSLSVTYIPIKDLSYGKNDCRVDILASNYKDSPSEIFAVSEPVEMNELQNLFASLTTGTTRDEIDAYIIDNGMVKHAFTQDSAYYIGYDNSAIRQRGRDREGEAVDINFVTSGDADRIGMVKSASYAVHTGSSTHTALKFEDGVFYYEGEACSNGAEAMQKYLSAQ